MNGLSRKSKKNCTLLLRREGLHCSVSQKSKNDCTFLRRPEWLHCPARNSSGPFDIKFSSVIFPFLSILEIGLDGSDSGAPLRLTAWPTAPPLKSSLPPVDPPRFPAPRASDGRGLAACPSWPLLALAGAASVLHACIVPCEPSGATG